MLMVTRYRVPLTEAAQFALLLGTALEAITARPGCRSGRVGRAVDDPELWLLSTEWESVGAYRRALSSMDVKLRAVPVMYRCLDEPTAYEELRTWDPATGLTEHATALADPQP